MDIIDLLAVLDKRPYLEQLNNCEWGAGRYLAYLIESDQFTKLCGSDSHVYLLLQEKAIVSFCSYVFQDEIQDDTLFPWIGFVYTYPSYRGNRYFGLLLKYIVLSAKKNQISKVYVSTDSIGLYEKYGFKYLKTMNNIHNELSRVYYLDI